MFDWSQKQGQYVPLPVQKNPKQVREIVDEELHSTSVQVHLDDVIDYHSHGKWIPCHLISWIDTNHPEVGISIRDEEARRQKPALAALKKLIVESRSSSLFIDAGEGGWLTDGLLREIHRHMMYWEQKQVCWR